MPIINGTSGDDNLLDTDGDDELNGFGGDDILALTNGFDIVRGGSGLDTLFLIYSASTSAFFGSAPAVNGLEGGFDGSYSDGAGRNVQFTSIERFEIFTGSGSDHIVTADGNDDIDTGAGNDEINGGGGNDRFFPGEGLDQVQGGLGDDLLVVRYAAATLAVTLTWFSDQIGGVMGRCHDSSGVRDVLFRSIERFDVETGSGNDDIGTASGDDIVRTGGGNDVVAVRSGNDYVELGDGDDFVDLGAGGVSDQAFGQAGVDGLSADYSGYQGEILINLQAGLGNLILTGFEYFGTFVTGGGDDLVVTRADLGRDETIRLGAGNDNAFVFNGNDIVEGGDGIDTLTIDYSSWSAAINDFSITVDPGGVAMSGHFGSSSDGSRSIGFTGIERLVITGTAQNDFLRAFGSTGNIISGGGGDDEILASNGNDIIDGGTGADVMFGGAGNDSYNVDNAGDRVEGGSQAGFDQVFASVSWSLATGIFGEDSAVELIATSNDLATTAIDLTGNGFAQTLRGNAGANALNGKGGADTLEGLGGNDLYIVDNAADSVVELAGEGDDTLGASTSYALAAGVSIEAMSTTSQSGTAVINLTGNDFAQSLFGNEGSNQLLGLGGNDQLVGYGGNDVLVGGGGIDYLRGGLGNDVYGIGEGDVILEVAGEGDDSLAADIGSYFLNDGASIETLSTANQAGTFAQNLTGNELGQTVAGSEGANVLNGNLGNDLLRGYGGADIFLFDTAAGANNHDVIADMQAGIDKIALQNAVFTGLAEGNLGGNAFRTGSAAQDADDRIIWNAATNQLFYDADGNGAGAAVLFAIVNGSPNLQATDFIIV